MCLPDGKFSISFPSLIILFHPVRGRRPHTHTHTPGAHAGAAGGGGAPDTEMCTCVCVYTRTCASLGTALFWGREKPVGLGCVRLRPHALLGWPQF